MLYLLSLTLLLFHLPGLTLSSPIDSSLTSPNPQALTSRDGKYRTSWYWKYHDLAAEFPGINWKSAFDESNCDDDKLNRIIFTTRGAMRMLDIADTPQKMYYSTAWNNYFYPTFLGWQTHGQAMHNRAVQIMNNMIHVQGFPKKGKGGVKGGNDSQKVTYTCQEQEVCKQAGTGAVTIGPSRAANGFWTIAFCPAFFDNKKLPYVEEREKGKAKLASEIWTLETPERVLIHEFMHVDKFGYHEHISDVKGTLRDVRGEPVVDVYGESRCYDFARKYGTRPNPDVVLNADNYSWFFTYLYFDNKWEWTKNGQYRNGFQEEASVKAASVKAASDSDEVQAQAAPEPEPVDASFPVDENAVEPNEKLPTNCRILDEKDDQGVNKFECDYTGDDGKCLNSPECKTPADDLLA